MRNKGKKKMAVPQHNTDLSNKLDEDESPNVNVASILEQNRKKKKSGGFQSMGLNYEILRGVLKKGYRVPTPIQRKTIPLILDGKDVVAMARTGSGKTAAFLVPMFQKLVMKSVQIGSSRAKGARALILSPTRELALQTLSFARELGKYTGLKAVCVLGGDSMEKQFAAMHASPDVVVATPGRFVHLCVEMGLKLDAVDYVVFDEADRLFEMGFGEQLREILGRLPEARQTVLFSATLPKLLVDFAKAGLTEPTLVRLDVDTKIPETLRLAFFYARAEAKDALLLHVLAHVVPAGEQVVVFAATRHHVEYLHALLLAAGIDNTFIYSQLDSTARKINAAKFRAGRVRILVVTDLAARGIDVPMLDNVVNYHFPAKSKLFVHRVGRVARAGRAGRAYSLVAPEELAYFVDLQLFLGSGSVRVARESDPDWHNCLGAVPQSVPDTWGDSLRTYMAAQDLAGLAATAANGLKQYLKSRPAASAESVKRAKAIQKAAKMATHPLLASQDSTNDPCEAQRESILDQMKRFRPSSTIFEIGNTAKNDKIKSVMTEKRSKHSHTIENYNKKREDAEAGAKEELDVNEETDEKLDKSEPTKDDIETTFKTVVQPKALKKAKVFVKRKDKAKRVKKDEENFINWQAKDHHTETGYSMLSGFEAEASRAVLDLTGDDDSTMRKKKMVMRWDVKKKKYVKSEQQNDGGKKKIKTESGVWIPASYKSDRYAKWRERSKLAHMQEVEEEQDGQNNNGGKRKRKADYSGLPVSHPAMKKARESVPKHKKGPKIELKRPEQILKQRKIQSRMQAKNQKKTSKGKRKRN